MDTDARRFRRIVVGNAEPETPAVFSDGPIPDIRTDPARPGFAMTRIWVTEDTPAPVRGVRDTLHLPHTLEPPVDGSVSRFVVIPPDTIWQNYSDEAKVRAFFADMGSPEACRWEAGAPHPYMQQGALQRVQGVNNKVNFLAQPQPNVGRHLVVAAASGV